MQVNNDFGLVGTTTMLIFRLFLVFVAVLMFFTRPAFAKEATYLEQLLEIVEWENLAEERTWHVLLHYTKTWTGGYRSRIDDPAFFLASEGQTDARAELEATLRSFFVDNPEDGDHGACRFPARFNWLSERLPIEPDKLPLYSCSERDKALSDVDAKSAVLVFPVGHINSPASMFGHTLIRIDGSNRSHLISHAVNYAAETTDTNGFLYAFKGLTGRYRGYYSLLPYYTKVKEYNDLEHRDMWEYRLKLSEEEVVRMVTHIWELYQIGSSYYFLDENCSYNLLFLIEAARPELLLTEKTGLLVLPTDTIRIALASGILEEPVYRPSQGTKIRAIMSRLDSRQQQLAYDLAAGKAMTELATVSDEGKAAVLDLAIEYTQLRYAKKQLEKSEFNQLYLALLRERSRVGIVSDSYNIVEPSRPETGHGTSRISLGAGIRHGKWFGELGLRPQFHELLDPDQGYLRGAQITFLDTKIRFSDDRRPVKLQSLQLLDILSITPRDRFFTPVSWKVRLGLDRETTRNGDETLLFRLNSGGGLAWDSPFNGILYTFAELDLNAGDKIRGVFTVGPGIRLGILEQITEQWKLNLQAQGFIYKVGDDRSLLRLSLAQNFKITRNSSITLEVAGEKVNSHRIGEVNLLLHRYF